MSQHKSRAPQRTQQFWMDHVTQWRGSGLSKAAYCKLHDLNPGNFYNWSGPKRSMSDCTGSLAQATRTSTATLSNKETPPSFIPLTLKPANVHTDPRFVHVERAATDIALPVDLSAEQIQQWLNAIHQLHV